MIYFTGINQQAWPVYGMYMPDAIHTVKIGNKTYLVTANEGDSKDYTGFFKTAFNEESRVKSLNLNREYNHFLVYV